MWGLPSTMVSSWHNTLHSPEREIKTLRRRSTAAYMARGVVENGCTCNSLTLCSVPVLVHVHVQVLYMYRCGCTYWVTLQQQLPASLDSVELDVFPNITVLDGTHTHNWSEHRRTVQIRWKWSEVCVKLLVTFWLRALQGMITFCLWKWWWTQLVECKWLERGAIIIAFRSRWHFFILVYDAILNSISVGGNCIQDSIGQCFFVVGCCGFVLVGGRGRGLMCLSQKKEMKSCYVRDTSVVQLIWWVHDCKVLLLYYSSGTFGTMSRFCYIMLCLELDQEL